ncbi:ester cyclase [Sphingomonas sp.]|uniref:ester cyclase n=1 Tax=Sphingomonas sp. TaxID=28214 RepID=UPI0025F7DFDB|nr:ester cyclase [Sphingomonas sp.]
MSAPALAGPAENSETGKRVFLEKMGQGRFDRLDEIYGPGFVAHGVDRSYTLDEDNASGKEWRRAVPDLKVEVLRTVAEGDFVAVYWHASGTNSVAAAGLPGLGGKAAMDGMTFFRFENGRIVEEWSVMDIATMMRQLAPPPKP